MQQLKDSFVIQQSMGGQKPGTANSTVTGAGSILISKEKSAIKIKAATIGKVQDLGIANPLDMGSAMAPARGSYNSATF